MSIRLGKILLIDDNPDDNFIHQRVIRKAGVAEEVVIAETGEEALEYLKQCGTTDDPKLPDLIFLDINMPGMNGWEFLEAYRTHFDRENPPVMIIMLTSSLMPSDEERAQEGGMIAEYLNKPLDKAALARLLEHHFDPSRSGGGESLT